MAENVILPKWGLTMEEGTVTAWRKAEGEAVTEGEVMAEIETDKINNELPAPMAGFVAKILVPAGETVPVGTTLVIVAASIEEAEAIRRQ